MSSIVRVSFVGNKDFCEFGKLKRFLPKIINRLMMDYDYAYFYVGRNNKFDFAVSSIVREEIKGTYKSNGTLIFVMPNNVKNAVYYKRYCDQIVIPICLKANHESFVAMKNRWLVENCNVLISYAKNEYCKEYEIIDYAYDRCVSVINLADVR